MPARNRVDLLALVLGLSACVPDPHVAIPRSPDGAAIATATLGLSNVHVLMGAHPLLVDTGSPDEFRRAPT